MKKKLFWVVAFIMISFALSCKTLTMEVSVPPNTAQGEFITVYFQADQPIEAPYVLMLSTEKKEVQKIDAFKIDDTNQNWVAVVGIATWYKPGDWTVKTIATHKKTLIEQEHLLKIAKTEFDEYVLNFDSHNTGIMRNKSNKRKAQAERLSEVLKTIDSNTARFSGPFTRPLTSERITSTFAENRIYKYTDGKSTTKPHWGVDFGTPIGTKVHCGGDGKVVMAENRITTGGTLVIEHAPGVYTLYYHLSETLVKLGDHVKAGEIVAHTGNTGLSTGPHLHWEMRINTIPVSPDFLSTNKLF